MNKINDWERDDIMNDYLQWKDELKRLLKEMKSMKKKLKELKI